MNHFAFRLGRGASAGIHRPWRSDVFANAVTPRKPAAAAGQRQSNITLHLGSGKPDNGQRYSFV